MITYKMEELLPIVAQLSRKYTSAESTSVSYEKAQQLMEAVLYCIQELEHTHQNLPANPKMLSPDEAYQLGLESVMQKAKETQKKYNEMINIFCDYGNENLRDTVTKAVFGFFKFYDPIFAPQNTIITMDYPVLDFNQELQGIDAIAAYVEAIYTEQLFLQKMPEEYVCNVLQQFHPTYQKQFFNISSILLRHILGDMMIEKRLDVAAGQGDYQKLFDLLQEKSTKELQEELNHCLEVFIWNRYNCNEELENYLKKDIPEFSIQLKQVKEKEYLKNVVVL